MKQVRRNGAAGVAISVALLMVVSSAAAVGGLTAHAGPNGSTAATGLSGNGLAGSALDRPVLGTVAPRSPEIATPTSPHPGSLNIFEPGPATSVDPAVDYETVGAGVVESVYQTLVTYSGNSTSSFVPVLATCVPGTAQCTTDYGTSLIKNGSGLSPEYWTFVIDPTARFYDPVSQTSWGVYPSDVMFSVARDLAWANPSGGTPGWILGQALLPGGNPYWDAGLHYPFNNTPENILRSMMINVSGYCPATAMVLAHGCITFVANGSGVAWSFFLELMADPLGASIVPCGWFTNQGAGLPGWTGPAVENGDASCTLPNGGTTTNGSSWSSYLAGLSPLSWDSLEALILANPYDPEPSVQYSLVGSGPYYDVNISPTSIEGSWTGYNLAANPAYSAPIGCFGEDGLAPYNGSCEPSPGSYLPDVNVTWAPSGNDTAALSAAGNGTMDFALPAPEDTSKWIALEGAGHHIPLVEVPTESVDQLSFNLDWNVTTYVSQGFPGTPTVPSNFFAAPAVRGLMVQSYPYSAIENSIMTISGVRYLVLSGGPIPRNMGAYSSSIYPPSGNVTFPNGTPDSNPNDTGGAGWWWAQGRNPTSAYYDAELAACSPSSPCKFPVVTYSGVAQIASAVTSFIASVTALTGDSVQPFQVELPFPWLFQNLTSAGTNPMPMYALGWAPDYPDPTDFMMPYALPNGTYSGPDALGQTMNLSQYDQAGACGHSAPTFADLAYWAQLQTITPACQGVAYAVAEAWTVTAGSSPAGSGRVLDYNLITHVLNALGLYIWMGQPTQIFAVAPWINLTSVNTNPIFGGTGDPFWFELRYVTGPASSPPSISVGTAPGTPMYDPLNDQIYVPNSGSGTVSVVSGSTDQVLATIPVGSYPLTPILDPANGEVFVANFLSGNVSVINGTLDLVTASLTVGTGPHSPAYDASSGRLFVANNGSNDVSVINGALNRVVATLPAGTEPESPALDTVNGELYVPNYGSGNVTVLNGSTDTRVASIAVGSGPASPVYDPASGDVYVPNYGSNTVSVIYGATNTVIATVLTGTAPFSPRGAGPEVFSRTTVPFGHPLYDPSNGDVYVTNAGTDNVTVISGTEIKVVGAVPVGSGPRAPVLDPADGNIYVANNGSNNLSVISATTNTPVGSVATGANPAPPVFDNASGKLYVPNTGSANVSAVPSSFYLTLHETGLPSGASWQVAVGAAPARASSIFSRTTVPFAVGNGSYAYTIVGPHGYRLVPPFSPVGTFTIAGADVPITVPFEQGTTSTLTFHEAGLPKGVSWCATVGWTSCSVTGSVVFANLTPWQYRFSLPTIPGFDLSFAHGGSHFEAPPAGLANVTTRAVTVKVKFTAVTYGLTFVETGLPPGKAWTVQLSYTYFGRALKKHLKSANADHLFEVPNGSFNYTVSRVAGYTTTSTGHVVVSGQAATVTVTFTKT